MTTISLPNGTTVTTKAADAGVIVQLHNDDAPKDLRTVEAGRIIPVGNNIGFQPTPFAAFGMTAAVLRAIADLIEAIDEEQR